MKQPELGKRISELRKAKGLTQEELVDRCKLSVRTLQRIEAGEVTPRGYTLRTIFAVLDHEFVASLDANPAATERPAGQSWLEQFYLYVFDVFNLKTNTMKKISILSGATAVIVLLLITLSSNSDAQSTTDARKSIDKANRDFIEWFNSGKIDQVLTLYHPDACIESEGCGKDFLKDYYTFALDKYKFVELATADFAVKGDVAHETGQFKLKMTNGMELVGSFTTEWRLVDKRWVIYKDAISGAN